MLLTDTPPRLDGRPWNSLLRCETVYLIMSLVVPDISWKFHKNSFTNFSIILVRNPDPENRKIDPGFKGLTTTSRKCSRMFLVSLLLKISISDKKVLERLLIQHMS